MKTIYRLPDGGTTKDAELFAESWRNLANPLLKIPGVTHIVGYDPGVLVIFDGDTLSLPTKFVKAITPFLKSNPNA